ncbi:hypothetical protein FRC07_012954 [Ceratobasidium sp. 392]|nr:hypothetical protein FRC07_012954 [Ceratobasidium sp. 392]
MVMMGATLWTHVRKWLFSQNGWMAERVLRLDGVKAERDQDDGFVSSSNDKVLHSAIAVQSDGTLRNVEISDEDESMMEPGILTHKPSLVLEAISDDEVTQSDAYTYSGDAAHEASDPGPSVSPTSAKPTIPPSVFEAIATSVALDVTNRAMCVIPAGISVGPVVENFRKLGVDARLLNLRDEIEHISRSSDEDTSIDSPSVTNTPSLASSDCQKSLVPAVDGVGESGIESPNPVLLITTTSSVRGLDIPTLSHIYIIGGMNSSAVYRHVAGRVGRFGMPGTVVSFVGVAGSENVVGISGGERKLRNIYKQIGAKVVPFAHIQ